MTNAEENSGETLAQHIAAALKDNPNAVVNVNPNVQAPIPPHIAGNLLEFLRRVESKGMEAVAWVEAYQFVQKHIPNPAAIPAALPK